MRSWLVIPAMGAASAGAAAALGFYAPALLIGAAAVGAATSAAVRALAGDSPASLVGAVLAPLLLLACALDPHVGASARALVGAAAAMWTMVELARPSTSPLVALLPAAIAAILSPAYVVLVAIAGTRLVTAPWDRPRWAPVVPALGILAAALAILSGLADHGRLRALADAWCAAPRSPRGAVFTLELAAVTLGPLTAVAAIAGLPALVKPRHAELAAASLLVGGALVTLRAGAIDPSLIALAALAAGLAVGRLAAMIRLPVGQAVCGATIAALVLAPPVWTALISR